MNYAVLPLTFVNEDDYDALEPEHQLTIHNLRHLLIEGVTRIPVQNLTTQTTIETSIEVSPRQRQILLAGGLLRYVGKESHV